jgi:hypothetical protein
MKEETTNQEKLLSPKGAIVFPNTTDTPRKTDVSDVLDFRFRFCFHKLIILILTYEWEQVMKMSETVQLEQLINEKTGVEEESRHLDEEQRQLKLRAKVLCEKIIQELKKKNNQKQQSVNQLQSRIGALEAQLNTLSVSSVLGEKGNESGNGNGDEGQETEAFEEEMQETDDSAVTVSEVDNEEMAVDIDEKQEKKKRKFF